MGTTMSTDKVSKGGFVTTLPSDHSGAREAQSLREPLVILTPSSALFGLLQPTWPQGPNILFMASSHRRQPLPPGF
jgi:hypothetical protein